LFGLFIIVKAIVQFIWKIEKNWKKT